MNIPTLLAGEQGLHVSANALTAYLSLFVDDGVERIDVLQAYGLTFSVSGAGGDFLLEAMPGTGSRNLVGGRIDGRETLTHIENIFALDGKEVFLFGASLPPPFTQENPFFVYPQREGAFLLGNQTKVTSTTDAGSGIIVLADFARNVDEVKTMYDNLKGSGQVASFKLRLESANYLVDIAHLTAQEWRDKLKI